MTAKQQVTFNTECAILNAEIDLKLFRKRLLLEKDEDVQKVMIEQIDQYEQGKKLLQEKLELLKLAK